MTPTEIKNLIAINLADNNTGLITPAKEREIFNAIADELGTASGFDLWNVLETYVLDQFCEYDLKIWKSKVADNIGNVPAENAFWTEVSKADSTPIREWTAGVYGTGVVIVFYNGELVVLDSSVSRPFQSTNIVIEMNAGKWKSLSSSGTAIKKKIQQNSHGFTVGNCIGKDAGVFVKCQATIASEPEFWGIVNSVIDGNNFEITIFGYIDTASLGLDANSTYYLSAAAPGLLTKDEPSGDGVISKPVLFTGATSEGIVVQMRGVVGGTAASGDGGSTTPAMEAWRVVGAAGQPAFSTYFENAYQTELHNLKFRKHGNLLYIKGNVRATDDVITNSLVCTFPADCRVAEQTQKVGVRVQNYAGLLSTLRFDTNGQMHLFDSSKVQNATYFIDTYLFLD